MMKKTTSLRRQKASEKAQSLKEQANIYQVEHRRMGEISVESEILETLKALQQDQNILSSELLRLNAELSLLNNSISEIQSRLDKDSSRTLEDKFLQVFEETRKNQLILSGKIQDLISNDKKSFLISLYEDAKVEKTISYQLGKALIDASKGVESLLRLPAKLLDLKNENENRKQDQKYKLKNVLSQQPKNIELQKNKNTVESITEILKNTEIKTPKVDKSLLNKGFSKALTLLDPISEVCWRDGFPGFAVSRNKFEKQIALSTSDFAFFESAWKANKSQWLYAFNSPNLQHDNAQDLLKVIGLLRDKKMPVVFWNKEDPMHYEMFKPIAKEADYVFTTDLLKVDQYKKDLGHEYVWALPFAAPIKITNPIDRFKLNTETVCFAGTYYAKNHPDRKKQMDMLLPALLDNQGAIYDRASNSDSENYQYPSIYRSIIREGVDFEEMTKLYKKFKVFLNVNTITQSPTMMSRRVYELLASGTPVVSTPSKAITEQFPGIVLTVRNEEEAQLAVKRLLTDSYFWNKQSVLGIREVMARHTYEDRWRDIRSKMLDIPSIQPADESIVKAVVVYHGYQDINFLLENIFTQSVEVQDCVVLISSSIQLKASDIDIKFNTKVVIKSVGNFNLNTYLKENLHDYTFITTDSVMLYKNCILDMKLSHKYHQGAAVTRSIIYDFKTIMLKDNLTLNDPNWFNFINQSNLDCVLVKNDHKDKLVVDFYKQTIKSLNSENDIYVIDPFNIVRINKERSNVISFKQYTQFKYKYETKLGI